MLNLPDKTAVVWQRFFKENKIIVYKYTVKQIKKAIQQNLDTVELFKFGDESEPRVVQQRHYLPMLEDALKEFIKVEDYEYAGKTKKIIDEYHINKLIKESNEV
jgi:protein-arginine kinase activator protein McsA